MAKLSTIEIAARQRHLFLLGKVKENKALSRAELLELKRYERQAAGKMTAKAGMASKVQAAATTKRIKKKAGKKKAKEKRKVRPPVDEAEIIRLGLEYENQADANAAIRTSKSLAELFRKYPELRQAWDRGQFLRNLRELARAGVSVSKAAKALGFANGQVLRAMIDEDEEVGNLWKQTHLKVFIKVHSAIVDKAEEGDLAAVRELDSFLWDEKERPEFDPYHIKINQLTELAGENNQRISEWHTKFGLPRNADKTYDLWIFIAWYKEFLIKKASAGKGAAAELDLLKAAKAEMITMELAKRRGELLDRELVMSGLLARHQIFLFWAERRPDFCSRAEWCPFAAEPGRSKTETAEKEAVRDVRPVGIPG